MGKLTSGLVVAVLVGVAGAVRADDGAPQTEREKKLEKRVEELERQLAEVQKRLADGGNGAGDELAQRVSELEKAVHKDDDGMFGSWKKTLWFNSADNRFKIRIGGRIQSDWSYFWKNQAFETASGKQVEAGEEFRRARLQVGGTLYENVDFMAEYDFAAGTAKFRDVWMGLRGLTPNGILQVGSFKEPFGLEELTPDLFIAFVERSAGDEAFAPTFNTGAMYSDTCAQNRVAWAFGVFRDANDFGDDTNNSRSGELNFTGRVAGRPWINDAGDQWVHLGLDASRRVPSDDTAQFRAHPELHLAPVLLDTKPFSADEVLLYDAEAAAAWGSLWGSAEYFRADVSRKGMSDPSFHAWAVQAGYFLTGETKPYNAKKAVFDRLVPKHDFGKAGSGAWEVAARLDGIDLNDAGVHGDSARILSIGLSWYLNPNTRVMLDWVRAHLRDVGTLDGIEARFQVDF